MFNILANNVASSAFGAIANLCVKVYKVDIFIIQAETYVAMIAYILGNFPSNYMIQRLGTRIPILLGVVINLLGIWMKCLIN